MAKKIYLSIPMIDKNYEEFIQAQAELSEKVSKYLNEDVSLAENVSPKTIKLNPAEYWLYFGERLGNMCKSDYVVFAEGYENVKRCRIEYKVASEDDKKILVEHGNEIQEVF